MTTELIGVIQEIVKNYIKVVRLTDKATGTVLTEAPLSVQVDASIPPISRPGASPYGQCAGTDRAGEGRSRWYGDSDRGAEGGRQGADAPGQRGTAVHYPVKTQIEWG